MALKFTISSWHLQMTFSNSAWHCAELSAAAQDITGYISPQFSVKDGSCQAERGLSFPIHVLLLSNVMIVGQFLIADNFLNS
jgi:hypothetical protein